LTIFREGKAFPENLEPGTFADSSVTLMKIIHLNASYVHLFHSGVASILRDHK